MRATLNTVSKVYPRLALQLTEVTNSMVLRPLSALFWWRRDPSMDSHDNGSKFEFSRRKSEYIWLQMAITLGKCTRQVFMVLFKRTFHSWQNFSLKAQKARDRNNGVLQTCIAYYNPKCARKAADSLETFPPTVICINSFHSNSITTLDIAPRRDLEFDPLFTVSS